MNYGLAHPDDCEISRAEAYANVHDCDGDLVFRVSVDMTDEDVWQTLELMNKAYELGARSGERSIQTQLRRLLGAAEDGEREERR